MFSALPRLSDKSRAEAFVNQLLAGLKLPAGYATKVSVHKAFFRDGFLFVEGIIRTTSAVVPEFRRTISGVGGGRKCIGRSPIRLCVKIHSTQNQCRTKSGRAMQTMRHFEINKNTHLNSNGTAAVLGWKGDTKAYPHLFFQHDSFYWKLGNAHPPLKLGHASGVWTGRVNVSDYESFAYGALFEGRYDFSVCISDLQGVQNRPIEFGGECWIPLLTTDQAKACCQTLIQRGHALISRE